MEKEKKQEETLKLIALFREREVLWNMNCFAYRRNDLKKKALEEIASECNLSTDAVKKRIKALRSTYIIERKKVEQTKKSGCAAASLYESSLYWYKEMEFLDSSIVIRKPIDNMKRVISDESTDIDDTTTSQSIESALCFTPSTSKRKREHEDAAKFDEALDKLVNLTKPTNDVYSAFAECICMQLRSMPEKDAYRAMSEMQTLLFQRKFSENRFTAKFQDIRTSSPETPDSDILFTAMSDADIRPDDSGETHFDNETFFG